MKQMSLFGLVLGILLVALPIPSEAVMGDLFPAARSGQTNPDPCAAFSKISVPINIVTVTTTQLVAASTGNYVYVCSLNIGPVAGAQNIALIEDDTAACASPTAGMAGGVTAATGWNIGANGGLVLGTGAAFIAKTAATARYVCLISSAAVQTSGVMTYVVAP